MTADAHPHVVVGRRWSGNGLTVRTTTSDCSKSDWCAAHEGQQWGLALPEAGMFLRRIEGVEQFVDANTGYFRRAGEVSQVAHPVCVTHTGTIIDIDPECAVPDYAEIIEQGGAFFVSPEIDLARRRLVAALGSDDGARIEAQCHAVLTLAVVQRRPDYTATSRRATGAARRRMVNKVCEHLHCTPTITLSELARAVHHSPFHVSRVFAEVTGMPVTRYRMQLRLHEATLRLGSDDGRLDHIACACGFADHSHLTRSMVAVYGSTPSELRNELRSRNADRHTAWTG
jgi:AraC-like DNA-binding protein